MLETIFTQQNIETLSSWGPIATITLIFLYGLIKQFTSNLFQQNKQDNFVSDLSQQLSSQKDEVERLREEVNNLQNRINELFESNLKLKEHVFLLEKKLSQHDIPIPSKIEYLDKIKENEENK